MAGSNKIVVDPVKLNELRRVMQEAAKQLQATEREMQAIAQQLEEGALQGRAGAAFSDGLKTKLCPAIQGLEAKFQELDGDILKVLDIVAGAEDKVEGLYSR